MNGIPKWSLEDAVEIKFDDEKRFLQIAESLTRIGRPNKSRELYQEAFVLHKRNKYYIIHYKALYALDGDHSHIYDIEDVSIQNKIAKLLEKWGLCEIIDKEKVDSTDDIFVKVVSWKDKENWKLIPNYKFGTV